MRDKKWDIGCSGFHYKEWKDIFYPKGLPQRSWFSYYATHFDTLELNVTFYRFPTLASLVAWYEKAPAHFTFSAKMPRSITHFKKFNATEAMVEDFYGLLKEGLKEKRKALGNCQPRAFNSLRNPGLTAAFISA